MIIINVVIIIIIIIIVIHHHQYYCYNNTNIHLWTCWRRHPATSVTHFSQKASLSNLKTLIDILDHMDQYPHPAVIALQLVEMLDEALLTTYTTYWMLTTCRAVGSTVLQLSHAVPRHQRPLPCPGCLRLLRHQAAASLRAIERAAPNRSGPYLGHRWSVVHKLDHIISCRYQYILYVLYIYILYILYVYTTSKIRFVYGGI